MSATPSHRSYHHGDLRRVLLEAAERSLRASGADQLSLRDLAREVGVSHAAPRRHFADRQELLDALASSGFDRLGRVLRLALPEADVGFSSQVRSVLLAFTRFAATNAALLELMHSSKHRSGARSVMEASQVAFEPVVELIHDGQRRGVLEAGPAEEIGLVLYATMQGIATLSNNGAISPAALEPVVETALRQFLRGAHPAVDRAPSDEVQASTPANR